MCIYMYTHVYTYIHIYIYIYERVRKYRDMIFLRSCYSFPLLFIGIYWGEAFIKQSNGFITVFAGTLIYMTVSMLFHI